MFNSKIPPPPPISNNSTRPPTSSMNDSLNYKDSMNLKSSQPQNSNTTFTSQSYLPSSSLMTNNTFKDAHSQNLSQSNPNTYSSKDHININKTPRSYTNSNLSPFGNSSISFPHPSPIQQSYSSSTQPTSVKTDNLSPYANSQSPLIPNSTNSTSLRGLQNNYFSGVVNSNSINSLNTNLSHNYIGSQRNPRNNIMIDIPPNHTLYCNNLNDKINKNELIASLYEFFTPFGNIISLQLNTTFKARGQAFVVFADISSATNALRTQQGKIFFNKPINIQYSKSKSDAILKQEGTFIPKNKKFLSNQINTRPTSTISSTQKIVGAILLVENIPSSVTKSTLDKLFSQYPGHIDTRLIAGRGIAFIDFTTQLTAEVAMDGLQNFKVNPTSSFKISFSKSI